MSISTRAPRDDIAPWLVRVDMREKLAIRTSFAGTIVLLLATLIVRAQDRATLLQPMRIPAVFDFSQQDALVLQ